MVSSCNIYFTQSWNRNYNKTYTGISLLTSISKVFTKILNAPLNKWVDKNGLRYEGASWLMSRPPTAKVGPGMNDFPGLPPPIPDSFWVKLIAIYRFFQRNSGPQKGRAPR